MYITRKLFTPCFQEPEGLDTASFFGTDQAPVDEATLPDATSDESLAMQPAPKDSSDGQDPPADGVTTEDPPADGKGVPLGALQEERTKRQQAQDRVQALETQNNTLLERMNKFLMDQQAPKQEAPPAPQIPDFIDDPVGHIEGLKAQFQQELVALRQELSGNTQYNQQQAQHNQLLQQVVVHENEYRAKTPDYDQAVDHFRAMKANEYAVLGLNQVQIQQQLSKDATGLAQMAMQRNQNPAEVLYSMAKALGYKAGTPTTETGQPPAPPKAAPTSLSSLPATGRAPDEKGKITAKDIATMSNEDFDKMWEGMKENSVQRPAY